MEKKTIAVIFGGKSSEHEVSCVSAATIIKNIDKNAYDILLIGITKDGRWIFTPTPEALYDGSWHSGTTSAILLPDAGAHGVLISGSDGMSIRRVDVIFPVLHGANGEDGTIQGLFELSQIPYVGCGVLASAVSMDKYYTKQIVDHLGIRQARYMMIRRQEAGQADTVCRIEQALGYPVFIKPCNAGSSCGVSKAHDRAELEAGLEKAFQHDRKVLVEENIDGREIECAVLGGADVKASGVGEILAAAEFYDYDAKYNNAESKTVVDPDIPADTAEQIRADAAKIFRAVDGFGLARVDFFVENATGQVVFNEINTLPGFTSISMYPMLWENRGLHIKDLVQELIDLAFERGQA